MSSKEERTRAAKQDSMLKAAPVKTFSATHPAYTYTGLCPDPKLRKPPRKRKGGGADEC